jgi:HK97 family phage major capsid protein
MKSIQELRERRTALATNLHDLLDKNPGDKWTPELQNQYDTAMAEIETIDGEAKRVQAVLEAIKDSATVDGVRNVAERISHDKKQPAHLTAFWNLMKNGERAMTQEDWGAIRNTMSVGTSAQGGYTVPTEVATAVADALKAYGGMRACAEVFRTATGSDINFPTSDGTSETGELIGENTTATGADPSFGVVTLKTYKFSSKIVAVPFELLQDSSIDMEAFIRNRLVTRLGRITNTYFTTGTGTAQPNGVVTAAGSGKVGTTGQTLTVIFDDLVDLIHSVDPAYRALGNCKFMMNDSSLKVIRKLKDTAGRPIFLPGYDGLGKAMPDTVLGYPIVINQDIAAMAANAKSILFGDFTFYKIRDAMDMQMFRFDDSAYIKLGQIGFLAWMRSGGNFVDVGGGVKYYANSAT